MVQNDEYCVSSFAKNPHTQIGIGAHQCMQYNLAERTSIHANHESPQTLLMQYAHSVHAFHVVSRNFNVSMIYCVDFSPQLHHDFYAEATQPFWPQM